MQISVTISGLSRLFGDDLAAIVDVARVADDAGHPPDRDDRPPGHRARAPTATRSRPKFPYPPEEPWPEPLTVLAAFAGGDEPDPARDRRADRPGCAPRCCVAKTRRDARRAVPRPGRSRDRHRLAARGVHRPRPPVHRPDRADGGRGARVPRDLGARAAGVVRVGVGLVRRPLVRAPPGAGPAADLVLRRGQRRDGPPGRGARRRLAAARDPDRRRDRDDRAHARRVQRARPRSRDARGAPEPRGEDRRRRRASTSTRPWRRSRISRRGGSRWSRSRWAGSCAAGRTSSPSCGTWATPSPERRLP